VVSAEVRLRNVGLQVTRAAWKRKAASRASGRRFAPRWEKRRGTRRPWISRVAQALMSTRAASACKGVAEGRGWLERPRGIGKAEDGCDGPY
jgi:hypothetical protein